MKVLASWLNDYLVTPIPPEAIAESLENAGIEVESIIHPPMFDSKIIIGEVVSVAKHPNADRLQLVIVDSGHGLVEVVCGAPNVTAGKKVVLAQEGATLPDGTVIKTTDIRGVKSHGMLASERELNLGTSHAGILILDDDTRIGTSLHEVITKDQVVIDITTAANRADLQSIIGLAREVSAHTQKKLELPVTKSHIEVSAKQLFKNQAPKVVQQYLLLEFKLPVTMSETPLPIKERLEASGVRPINVVVDITNYVMIETGQPLHAFDAAKVVGQVVVRKAKLSEKVTTLDQVERSLSTEDIVIADQEKVIGIAGIMGGSSSEITEETRHILLESAIFNGTSLRKTALRLGLRTEASSRFERGLPLLSAEAGLNRAVELLEQQLNIELVAIGVHTKSSHKQARVEFSVEKFNSSMSIKITSDKAIKYLKRLGITTTRVTDDMLEAEIPYWRGDLKIAEDVYEELIKLEGLERVPATIPEYRTNSFVADTYWSRQWSVRNLLVGKGLFEVVTYPFVSQSQLELLKLKPDNHLELENPRSSEQRYLRTTLIPNLLTSVATNKTAQSTFGLFEVANTYRLEAKRFLPNEVELLGIIMYSRKSSYAYIKNVLDNIILFTHINDVKYTIKSNISYLHPKRQAVLSSQGEHLGVIGQVDPRITMHQKLKGEVSYLELESKALLNLWREPVYQPYSQYQVSKRDLSFTVKKTTNWQDIYNVLVNLEVGRVYYVGEYTDPKKATTNKTVTIHLEFSSDKKTLSDQEIEQRLGFVKKNLRGKFRASVSD